MDSDNAGSTWQDISAGLTALPVNKILYRHGVINSQLFAGTDAGVYKWMPLAGTWACYNNGLPVCTVMDMEINYCANKLRIATYGRGMWETTMDDGPLYAEAPTTSISGIVTWSSSEKYLQSSVDVKAGAKLYIRNCTIHMPKNAVISVEPGGFLDVNNSTITNDCENCWWQGIEARGQVSLSQKTLTNQGRVFIENNSIIQHAKIGVSNCDATVGWPSNGGIIQCLNSTFRNNNIDASFSKYDNFWPDGTLHPNISYFTNCTFLLDDSYKGDAMGPAYRMNYMVLLKSVEGINFTSCTFLNRNTHANSLTGDGIHSINSAFSVLPSCPPFTSCYDPTVRSRFCGLTHGIDILGLWQPTLAISIDRADFDSCSIGVDVFKFNSVATTRCNFNVGRGLGIDSIISHNFNGCSQNIGILLQNAKQYRVEANTFIGLPNGSPDWYNIGAAVTSPGTETETIYRNTFGDNLTTGVIGVATSPGSVSSGLKVACNTFVSNNVDMISTNNTASPYYQGLSHIQVGSVLTAGNTFAGSNYNILNYCVPVSVVYYYDAAVAAEFPSIIGGTGSVYRIPESTKSTINGCAAGPFPGELYHTGLRALDGKTLLAHKMTYFQQKALLIDSTHIHDSLIDFGSTNALINTIDQSSNSQQLYIYLSSGSPYLSVAALEEVANKQALSYWDFMALLKQNPDNLLDYSFYTTMKSAYNFSPADSDSIQVWSQILTRRTGMENAMNQAQLSIANEGNIIMSALKSPTDPAISIDDSTGTGLCTDSNSIYFMLDSNVVYAGLDSLDAWLVRDGDMNAQYDRVGYYNWRGQSQAANQILQSIVPKTFEDQDMYNTYTKVWSVLSGAASTGRNEYELDDNETATLNSLGSIEYTSNSGALTAHSLASLANVGKVGGYPPTEFPPCLIIQPHNKYNPTTLGVENTAKPESKQTHDAFSVHPNPVTSTVTFTYNLQDACDEVVIKVTGLTGESVLELHTGNSKGDTKWNTANLSPGIYTYIASCKNGIMSKGKIIVMRKD